MSKTFRKFLRLGICWGSNTSYYRTKRKWFRRKSKQLLHTSEEDFVNPEDLKAYKDSWDEPTDGTYLVDKKYALKNYQNSKYLKKFLSILKPKKRKHYAKNSNIV